jgi:hypothetical protein
LVNHPYVSAALSIAAASPATPNSGLRSHPQSSRRNGTSFWGVI